VSYVCGEIELILVSLQAMQMKHEVGTL